MKKKPVVAVRLWSDHKRSTNVKRAGKYKKKTKQRPMKKGDG